MVLRPVVCRRARQRACDKQKSLAKKIPNKRWPGLRGRSFIVEPSADTCTTSSTRCVRPQQRRGNQACHNARFAAEPLDEFEKEAERCRTA